MKDDQQARRSRIRWVTLGEAIAIAALVISGLGLWHEWGNRDKHPAPVAVVEQQKPIPLVLRGQPASDGRALDIAPVEQRHALESLVVTIKGAEPVEIGSDGRLQAGDVEQALEGRDKEPKDKTLSVPVKISARYVENGADRRGGGSYTLRYRWEGGGLFGGRSLRLVSLSR
jgi:hypothetical protein